MAGTCCGRRAARVTLEGINEGIGALRQSIELPAGAAGLERDPNCGCDPCMCPSDDVPCNARYLGDDLSDRGLQQALDRVVRHARQVQAAGDACDCATRPRRPQTEEPESPERPVSTRSPGSSPLVSNPNSLVENHPREPVVRPPFVFNLFRFPPEVRNVIYEHYFGDARRLLTTIAAVRVGNPQGSETRIRRYIRNTPRERRRRILDPRYERERPDEWEGMIPNSDREMAAITYEAYASDDELAQLPNDPLALLRVSRQARDEASATFFERFRFTNPWYYYDYPHVDSRVHHGILAAETFFTDQTANLRRQVRHIELDLGHERSEQSFDRGFMQNEEPRAPNNWTNGIDRLGVLSNTLRQMDFQQLTLNFTGQPDNWWESGITDPRNPMPGSNDPVAPWAVDLFRIGPRRRLRLQLQFRFERAHPDIGRAEAVARNNYPLYNAIRTLSMIRRFLLFNAQAMDNQYRGIRVLLWVSAWDLRAGRQRVGVIVECDDLYQERSDSIVSRLRDRTFGVEGEPQPPTYNYSAADFPPPHRDPPPPLSPLQRTREDDEEDRENPSILGP